LRALCTYSENIGNGIVALVTVTEFISNIVNFLVDLRVSEEAEEESIVDVMLSCCVTSCRGEG
jgi:hypothetical protein